MKQGLGLVGVLCIVGACVSTSETDSAVDAGDTSHSVLPDGGLSEAGETSDSASSSDAPDNKDAPGNDVPATPAVQYIGRWRMASSEAIAGYPASRMVVRFRGTSGGVTVRDSIGTTWLDITVDGGAPRVVTVAGDAPTVLPVVTGLSDGVHVVEIAKRTEEFAGIVHISNVSFPGGGQLLAPPARRTRHLEVIGNSTIDGYGVDGARGAQECATNAVHNANRSLIPLLGDALSAETYAPSVSGTGVLYNENPLDKVLIHTTYPRYSPLQPELWNFETWQPDAVLIVIGGTDIANPAVDPPPSQATFSAAYERFLSLVRTKNPNAAIFAGVSATISDDYPATDSTGHAYAARTKLIAGTSAAVSARNTSGDSKVYSFVFATASDSERGACSFHPTYALYQRMANEIAPVMRAKLGW